MLLWWVVSTPGVGGLLAIMDVVNAVRRLHIDIAKAGELAL